MFKETEKPLIEIELSNDEIYRKNIEKLIDEKSFQCFLLHTGEKLNNTYISKIKEKILTHPQKIFFGEVDMGIGLKHCKNYVSYQAIYVDSALQSDLINSEAEMFILYFDVCNYYGGMEWKNIKSLLYKIGDRPIFINMRAGCKQFKISNYINIMECLKNMEYTFSLMPLFKTTSMIVEHPCNAYMCSGVNCHSEKNSYPRYLYVTQRGIFPYCCESEKLNFLEDIGEREITSFEKEFYLYKDTKNYQVFIECNKRIYYDIVIPHIMPILPWNILMEYVLENRDTGEKNVNI